MDYVHTLAPLEAYANGAAVGVAGLPLTGLARDDEGEVDYDMDEDEAEGDAEEDDDKEEIDDEDGDDM